MKLFDIFKKKNTTGEPLTLEKVVEIGVMTKEEMLLIKKERATREWVKEVGGATPPAGRSHHKKH